MEACCGALRGGWIPATSYAVGVDELPRSNMLGIEGFLGGWLTSARRVWPVRPEFREGLLDSPERLTHPPEVSGHLGVAGRGGMQEVDDFHDKRLGCLGELLPHFWLRRP